MPYVSHRFIDPRALAAIADLQLVAKAVVDGFMFGPHGSRIAGAGLEFSQYRSYQPGDDPRRVDWKLYARSDRYYVREADAEMSVTVRFVLDASGSMAQDDGGLTKFDYARFLIASLGYLASVQGDEIALVALNDDRPVTVPAGRDRQSLHRFLHALETLEPAGRWPDWSTLEGRFTAAPRRELVVVVSDLHEHAAEITTMLSKVSALRNEALVLHVLARDELEFRYGGAVLFEELETGRTVEVDTDRIRADYVAAVERDLTMLRHTLQNARVAYRLFTLDQPLDYALRAYLAERAHLG